MTKISCEECRVRLGEVLAWEVAQGGVEAPDLAALRAHLDGCPACASDLKILRGARESLREFGSQNAPDDLRARIRSQLEREPQARTQRAVETPSTPAAMATEVLPANPIFKIILKIPCRSIRLPQRIWRRCGHEPNRRDVRDGWDKVLKFFSRPANVAWTSGLALAAFCLVLFIQPGRRALLSESPDAALSQRQTSSADQSTRAAAPQAKKAAANSKGTSKAVNPTGKNGAPLPTTSLPSSWPKLPPLDPPSNFPDGTPRETSPPLASAAQNQDAPATKPARLVMPGGASRTPSTRAPNASSPNTSSGAPFKTAPLPTAPSSAPRGENQNDFGRRRDTSLGAAMKASTGAAPANAASDSVAQAPSPSPASEEDGSYRSNNGLAANAPRAAMKSAGANHSFSAQAEARNGNLRDKDEHQSTPVTRFVSSRITPPRDIGWGQVSVILSGGARFSDGGKSRVIWQGAASSGEPIDISFSVAAPRGSYSARLVLQEVKHGDAQTVASKSVDVDLH